MRRARSWWRPLAVVGLCGSLPLLPWSCAGDPPSPPPLVDDLPPLGPDEVRLKVDQRCPGDPGCIDGGDDTLLAGVGKVDITPLVESFTDSNSNGVWDAGEPYVDRNRNGRFDAYWMAGFGNGRLAYGVNANDGIWARAVALRQNHTTVVVVAVDALGLFAEETAEVQKLLAPSLDIDLLLVHATHVHQNADLVGGWGPDAATNGVNSYYQTQVRQGIAAAAKAAIADLGPVRVSISSIAVEDGPNHDMHHYVSDARDPVVIDNTLHTIQLLDTSVTPPKPKATVVNWAAHPESAGSDNHLITSDFVNFLRNDLESQGAGTVVYISGALGGQIGPGRVAPLDDKGVEIPEHSLRKAEFIGKGVAKFALTALADPNARSIDGKAAKLSFKTAKVNVQIANEAYHLALLLGVYKRTACCYDTSRPIDQTNEPSAETRIAYVQLGPLSIITNPGELLPELFIGGYGGDHAGAYPFIDLTKPNFPDVSRAPKPPYLIDLMSGERPHRMTFGLTMDFLGYIVPRYNWLLDEKSPYFSEAKGDHYEETNSVGPLAEPQIVGTMRQLIQAK